MSAQRERVKQQEISPVWGAQLLGKSSRTPKKVAIPSQGTCLGCGFDSTLGHVQEATNRCLSLSLSLSLSSPLTLPLSLKVNEHILE